MTPTKLMNVFFVRNLFRPIRVWLHEVLDPQSSWLYLQSSLPFQSAPLKVDKDKLTIGQVHRNQNQSWKLKISLRLKNRVINKHNWLDSLHLLRTLHELHNSQKTLTMSFINGICDIIHYLKKIRLDAIVIGHRDRFLSFICISHINKVWSSEYQTSNTMGFICINL